jgi:F-box/leucine-rich repeat protein 14
MTVLFCVGCYNITDGVLEDAFFPEGGSSSAPLSHLSSLNLAMCKRITDEGFAAVAAACPALERLDLGGCTRLTNDTLRVMAASRMRNSLRWLNLRSCWLITDAGVGFLTGSVGTTVKTTTEGLDDDDEDDVTDAATTTGMTALEELILQDCQEVSDAALRMLQEGSGGGSGRRHIPPLRRLNLSFCANITDSGLRCVGRMASLESSTSPFVRASPTWGWATLPAACSACVI